MQWLYEEVFLWCPEVQDSLFTSDVLFVMKPHLLLVGCGWSHLSSCLLAVADLCSQRLTACLFVPFGVPRVASAWIHDGWGCPLPAGQQWNSLLGWAGWVCREVVLWGEATREGDGKYMTGSLKCPTSVAEGGLGNAVNYPPSTFQVAKSYCCCDEWARWGGWARKYCHGAELLVREMENLEPDSTAAPPFRLRESWGLVFLLPFLLQTQLPPSSAPLAYFLLLVNLSTWCFFSVSQCDWWSMPVFHK